MSIPCKNSLTNRELNLVYQKISDKFVDTLCSQMINDRTVSGNFSKILEDKMIEVLGKAETQNKMADAILQSVGTTLRHSTKGPYLLYALLNNTASYKKVEEVMTKVFMDIFKDGDNKKDFVDRLARVLNEPHPGLFITPKLSGGRTHKRRKTDKKVRKSCSVRGGTLLEKAGQMMSKVKEGVKSAGSSVKSGFSKIGQAVQKKYNRSIENGSSAAPNASPNAVNRSSNGAIDTSNSGFIANDLYFDYEKILLNTASKNLNTTGSIMSKKMVNASYIYMLKNGQTVLDAVRSNIETSLSNQSTSYDVNRIIIIQALFSAIRELTRSIHTIAKKRDKISPGFDPRPPPFISEVIDELLQNIQGELKIE